jgi:hypothetical protein
MDKQTLEDIRTIICNEYLNKKDEILKDELNGKIGSCRATELRTKLIGMMTTVEIIQREIKNTINNNYVEIIKRRLNIAEEKWNNSFIDYDIVRYGIEKELLEDILEEIKSC